MSSLRSLRSETPKLQSSKRPRPPHIASVPLAALIILQEQGIFLPTLASDLPLLHSCLSQLPLHHTLASPSAVEELVAANEQVTKERQKFIQARLPLLLLRRVVAEDAISEARGSFEVVKSYIAEITAQNEFPEAKFIPRSVWEARRLRVSPDGSFGTRDDEWERASANVATYASSLLEDITEVWTSALGPSAPSSMLPNEPPDMPTCLKEAHAAIRKLFVERDVSSARSFVCGQATTRAELDALRLAAPALERQAAAAVKSDSAEAAALHARAEATAAKVRLIRAEAMRDTYCIPGAVKSLNIARDFVDERKKEVERKLAEKEKMLRAYAALGKSFTTLVDSYVRAEKEAASKRWSLSQLCGPGEAIAVSSSCDDVSAFSMRESTPSSYSVSSSLSSQSGRRQFTSPGSGLP